MERILQKYRDKGLKLTPQRLEILKYLDGNTSHPTADDIFRHLKGVYPTVSFATVYNTLETLRDRGEILEVTIDPDRKHFDPNTTPHHHIMCTKCRKIGDIFADYADTLSLPERISDEFIVMGNHVDFYGVCRDCILKT